MYNNKSRRRWRACNLNSLENFKEMSTTTKLVRVYANSSRRNIIFILCTRRTRKISPPELCFFVVSSHVAIFHLRTPFPGVCAWNTRRIPRARARVRAPLFFSLHHLPAVCVCVCVLSYPRLLLSLFGRSSCRRRRVKRSPSLTRKRCNNSNCEAAKNAPETTRRTNSSPKRLASPRCKAWQRRCSR